MMLYRAGGDSGKCFGVSIRPHESQGDRARGISAERFEIPLAGGGAQFAPWGEPSPPRLSPGGNGKGGLDSLLPQANCFGILYLMSSPMMFCLLQSCRAARGRPTG